MTVTHEITSRHSRAGSGELHSSGGESGEQGEFHDERSGGCKLYQCDELMFVMEGRAGFYTFKDLVSRKPEM